TTGPSSPSQCAAAGAAEINDPAARIATTAAARRTVPLDMIPVSFLIDRWFPLGSRPAPAVGSAQPAADTRPSGPARPRTAPPGARARAGVPPGPRSAP